MILRLILATLTMTFCRFAIAAERFVIIGEAEAPDVLATSREFGMFAEKIVPGSQLIIMGAVVALSFDSRLSNFDISSRVRMSCHGDTADTAALPELALTSRRRGSKELPDQLRLWKKGPSFNARQTGKNIAISTSASLLEEFQEAAKMPEEGDDLMVRLYPYTYLRRCPGNVPRLKEYIENALDARKGGWELPDSDALEHMLRQFERLTLKVAADEAVVKMSINATGAKGSEFAALIAALPGNEIDSESIAQIVQHLSGNSSFDIAQVLDRAVFAILSKFFPAADPRDFTHLFTVKASHDKSSATIEVLLTQNAVVEALARSQASLHMPR